MTCKIVNVSVRVISLAFGWADNSYLDMYIDNSAYHKNLIQYLIILDITLNVIQ